MQVQVSFCSGFFVVVMLLSVLAPRCANCQAQTSDSNVGYIDDAIVCTQLRMRFDAAYGNDRPDRAEFFMQSAVVFASWALIRMRPAPHRALNGRDPATTRFIETNVDYQDITPQIRICAVAKFLRTRRKSVSFFESGCQRQHGRFGRYSSRASNGALDDAVRLPHISIQDIHPNRRRGAAV